MINIKNLPIELATNMILPDIKRVLEHSIKKGKNKKEIGDAVSRFTKKTSSKSRVLEFSFIKTSLRFTQEDTKEESKEKIISSSNGLNKNFESENKTLESAAEESSPKTSKDEISDAISEIVDEKPIKEEFFEKKFNAYEKERALYSLVESHKGLDYSKLHYGKIAEPLAIQWNYSNYQKDDDDEPNKFVAEETFSMEEVDDIIEEKRFADILGTDKNFTQARSDDQFKYFMLFNEAMVLMKYDPYRGNNNKMLGYGGM